MSTRRHVTIEQVERANPTWFSYKNMQFFHDIGFDVGYSKSGKPYLIHHTNAWTDMFDGIKKPHYRLHTLDGTTILDLLDDEFKTIDDVKEWLNNN